MTYVMSDIHGNYQKFKTMLDRISFGEDDVLYLLGDLVDYGEESMELIEDISYRLNVYPVAGEHDFLAARMLKGFSKMLSSGSAPDAEYIAQMTAWVQDGGQTTLEGFRALDEDAREGVLEYLEDMTLFEEVTVKGQDYLLLHAGIADFDADTDLEDYQPEDFFTEPLDASYPLMEDKILIVGHVPTASGKITRGEGSILIDCGAGEGGQLGCLCLETGEEYYA
ncbi:MAG: metallophosphoesterase [Clostridia bacterium]|nr:metallophosphoesterase [Clostridia bacterium]